MLFFAHTKYFDDENVFSERKRNLKINCSKGRITNCGEGQKLFANQFFACQGLIVPKYTYVDIHTAAFQTFIS